MKKWSLVLILLIFTACKNEKKDQENTKPDIEATETIEVEKEEQVLNELILPSHNLWSFNRLSFEADKQISSQGDVFKLSRTSLEETAYAVVNDIPVIYGSKYRLSVIVKKGDVGHLFGLRAIGEYPNRIDAVFDLKNGFVNDNESSGNFIEGKATITPLEDGWYKCSIISEFDADMIKVIFGPTSGLGKTIAWEAKTNDLCEGYIIPSSLTLEEISI